MQENDDFYLVYTKNALPSECIFIGMSCLFKNNILHLLLSASQMRERLPHTLH